MLIGISQIIFLLEQVVTSLLIIILNNKNRKLSKIKCAISLKIPGHYICFLKMNSHSLHDFFMVSMIILQN